MTIESYMLSKKLSNLLLILPLILGLGVVAYRSGPVPKDKGGNSEASAPVEVQPGKQEQTQPANSRVMELFGMYETAVAKGQAEVTPTEYLNSVEIMYLRRGYRKVGENIQPVKRRAKAGKRNLREITGIKFFQRDESNGIGSISATGQDADYSSDKLQVDPFTFTTLVVPGDGGLANWATYRMGIDRNKLAQLANLDDGDFPGADPIGIPRLQGLQRIYALQSGGGSLAIYKSKMAAWNSILLQYLVEMPRHGWRLDSGATSDASNVVPGVMCFTQGTRSCMIWVTPSNRNGAANVTISSH
jgi:hypothetical protein